MNTGIVFPLPSKLSRFLRQLAVFMVMAYYGSAWANGELIRFGTLLSNKNSSLAGLNFVSAISVDGNAIVGSNGTADGATRAFRWTEAGGMQSLADWLKAVDARTPADYLAWDVFPRYHVSADGNIVVGTQAGTLPAVYSYGAPIFP